MHVFLELFSVFLAEIFQEKPKKFEISRYLHWDLLSFLRLVGCILFFGVQEATILTTDDFP